MKQKLVNYAKLKALALSVVILAGAPNLVMILFSVKSITALSVAFLVGIASTHLMK